MVACADQEYSFTRPIYILIMKSWMSNKAGTSRHALLRSATQEERVRKVQSVEEKIAVIYEKADAQFVADENRNAALQDEVRPSTN